MTFVRVVGEPIWAGRTDEEYPACAEHEALINVALGDAPAYIQCPYDTSGLPASVLTDAEAEVLAVADGGRHDGLCRRDEEGHVRVSEAEGREAPKLLGEVEGELAC